MSKDERKSSTILRLTWLLIFVVGWFIWVEYRADIIAHISALKILESSQKPHNSLEGISQ